MGKKNWKGFDLLSLLNRVCGEGDQESEHRHRGHRGESRGAFSQGHDRSGGNLQNSSSYQAYS